MKRSTATEASRSFSRVRDQAEQGRETFVIIEDSSRDMDRDPFGRSTC